VNDVPLHAHGSLVLFQSGFASTNPETLFP
jgi:hypothetical protein